MRVLPAAAAVLALSGCELFGPAPQAGRPLSLEESRTRARLAEQASLPGQAVSIDGGQPSVTWPASVLAEEFENLAFGAAAARDLDDGGRLQKWNRPVRIGLFFGRSVPASIRSADRSLVRLLAARLEHYSGLPVSLAESSFNIRIFVMNAEEIVMTGTAAQKLAEGPGSLRCTLSVRLDESPDAGISEVTVYIRSDIPDPQRRNCHRQQLARSLGFMKGSEGSIPSILSGSQQVSEFTSFDDLMLRLMYDPRLRPGMTRREARAAVQVLASDLGAP